MGISNYYFNICSEDYEPFEDHPEKKLLIALIERALCDLWDSERHIRRDARGWVNSNSYEPFTFLWTLSYLNLEHLASKIRKAAKKNRIDRIRIISAWGVSTQNKKESA